MAGEKDRGGRPKIRRCVYYLFQEHGAWRAVVEAGEGRQRAHNEHRGAGCIFVGYERNVGAEVEQRQPELAKLRR